METSSLSSIVWINQRINVVCFSSGWLTGVNKIKFLADVSYFNSNIWSIMQAVKFDKGKHIELDDEIN